MYRNILVAIEHSDADATILTHVEELAKMTGASLLLVHVADGWAARHYEDLKLRESQEMREDRPPDHTQLRRRRVEHGVSGDVGRHHVRRELHAPVRQRQCLRERAHE